MEHHFVPQADPFNRQDQFAGLGQADALSAFRLVSLYSVDTRFGNSWYGSSDEELSEGKKRLTPQFPQNLKLEILRSRPRQQQVVTWDLPVAGRIRKVGRT